MTVVIDDENSLPTEFSLAQNYPNPFNSATTIRFALPEKIKLAITIYDIKGNLIATLVDESMEAGRHQVVWNAADVSSGVYFYHLKSEKFSEMKKCVLMK